MISTPVEGRRALLHPHLGAGSSVPSTTNCAIVRRRTGRCVREERFSPSPASPSGRGGVGADHHGRCRPANPFRRQFGWATRRPGLSSRSRDRDARVNQNRLRPGAIKKHPIGRDVAVFVEKLLVRTQSAASPNRRAAWREAIGDRHVTSISLTHRKTNVASPGGDVPASPTWRAHPPLGGAAGAMAVPSRPTTRSSDVFATRRRADQSKVMRRTVSVFDDPSDALAAASMRSASGETRCFASASRFTRHAERARRDYFGPTGTGARACAARRTVAR